MDYASQLTVVNIICQAQNIYKYSCKIVFHNLKPEQAPSSSILRNTIPLKSYSIIENTSVPVSIIHYSFQKFKQLIPLYFFTSTVATIVHLIHAPNCWTFQSSHPFYLNSIQEGLTFTLSFYNTLVKCNIHLSTTCNSQ